jgi:hypothetical protein
MEVEFAQMIEEYEKKEERSRGARSPRQHTQKQTI